MIGPAFGSRLGLHLGTRVSALLDGQLSPAEEERAWCHVRSCDTCRDLVQREGWIKTQLAGLSASDAGAPAHLKGLLAGGLEQPSAFPDRLAGVLPPPSSRHWLVGGLVGGGALGAAMVGVLLLSAPPAQAPAPERGAPAAGITLPSGPAPAVRTPPRRDRMTPAVTVRGSTR